MWPLYPLSNNIIGITITSEYLRCSWVNKSHQYLLHAVAQHSLDNLEIIDGILYNPTKVKQLIQQFLQDHKLADAYAVIALEDSGKNLDQQHIIQYQLLALSIPLHCIMITSCSALSAETPTVLHDSFARLTNSEVAYAINLYNLGKEIYENAS